MRESKESCVCPYFNSNEARCSERFTLERMAEVFRLCLGDHHPCEVYQDLTLNGQPIHRHVLAQAG